MARITPRSSIPAPTVGEYIYIHQQAISRQTKQNTTKPCKTYTPHHIPGTLVSVWPLRRDILEETKFSSRTWSLITNDVNLNDFFEIRYSQYTECSQTRRVLKWYRLEFEFFTSLLNAHIPSVPLCGSLCDDMLLFFASAFCSPTRICWHSFLFFP